MLRAQRNGVLAVRNRSSAVPRTGQPSTRDGSRPPARGRDPRRARRRRRARDERARPAHGHPRRAPSRASSARSRGRARRARRRRPGATGSGVRIVRLANAVLGRLDVRDARTPAPRGARPRCRRDGDAARSRARRTRSPSTSSRRARYLQDVTQLGRPSDRARDLGGQGDARLRRPCRCRAARSAPSRRGRSPSADALARGDRARPRAGLRRGDRGARAGPQRRRRAGLVDRRARSPRSSRSRARRALRPAPRSTPRSRRCSTRARAISLALGWEPCARRVPRWSVIQFERCEARQPHLERRAPALERPSTRPGRVSSSSVGLRP